MLRRACPPKPRRRRVRVKGCGKSAPRTRQRGRHGKPRLEQDQIGTARLGLRQGRALAGLSRPGRSREPRSDARSRGMAAAFGLRFGRHRTRLIGRLIRFSSCSEPIQPRHPSSAILECSMYVLKIVNNEVRPLATMTLETTQNGYACHCLPIHPMLTQLYRVASVRG